MDETIVRCGVKARMAHRSDPYVVHVEVLLPPSYSPLVVLKPHERVVLDEPYDVAAFAEFLRQADRILAERDAIVEALKRDWRIADADMRRFKELEHEFEVLSAQLEQPRSTLN